MKTSLSNWVQGLSRSARMRRIEELTRGLYGAPRPGLTKEEHTELQALNAYRRSLPEYTQRSPTSADILQESLSVFLSWRNAKSHRATCKTRLHRYAHAGLSRNLSADKPMANIYADAWPFRDWGDCDAIAPRSIHHTGWYCDADGWDTLRGRVLQLPSKNGVLRYIAGTYSKQSDGIKIYTDRILDDKIDAALYADECARREAESAREADIKYQAEQEIESKKEEIADIRNTMKAVIRELKSIRKYQLLSVQPQLPFMGEEKPEVMCQAFPLLIQSATSRLRARYRDKTEAAQRIAVLTVQLRHFSELTT